MIEKVIKFVLFCFALCGLLAGYLPREGGRDGEGTDWDDVAKDALIVTNIALKTWRAKT